MEVSYYTIYQPGKAEIVEKKSRFLANTAHVETEDEAMAFVEEIRKHFWDARHHCYAYILGKNGEQPHSSDDGEPSQTAGKPILDVMTGVQLKNSIVVVTRYFGGTLLGTGGLVRAYSQAAREGIQNSMVIQRIPAVRLQIQIDYTGIGRILYFMGQQGYPELESEYTQQVRIVILVPLEKLSGALTALTELTNGKAILTEEGKISYAMIDHKLVLFQNE